MIRHCALLTLDDSTTAADRRTIIEAIYELPAQIPAIRQYSVGIDLGLAEDNASIAIIADFDDTEGYETYRDHPAHRDVIKQVIAPRLTARAAAQYEI